MNGRSKRIVSFRKGAFARNIERSANDRRASNNRDQAGATVYAATTFYWTERPRQRHIRFQSVPQHTSRRTTTRQSVDEILRLVVKTVATLNDHARMQDQNFALEFRFYRIRAFVILRDLSSFFKTNETPLVTQREWRFQNVISCSCIIYFLIKSTLHFVSYLLKKITRFLYNRTSTISLPRKILIIHALKVKHHQIQLYNHIKFKGISFQ